MFNPITLFTGNPWVYAGVFVAGLAAGATPAYLITASVKDNTIKELKLEKADQDLANAKGLLKQFTDDSNNIHGAAILFGQTKISLDNQFNQFSKDLQDAVKKMPLPAGCKPTADRLRSLTAAVAAANAARTIGQSTRPAVPTHP